ncbi:MAG: hypothetical protein ACYDHP_00575 [Ferrimicrobium sp.]
MAFPSAGQFGPEVIVDQNGNLAPGLSVTVYEVPASGSPTTLATLYTSSTMAATAPNPLTTSSTGNLTFFAQPGPYVLEATLNGVTTQWQPTVAPWPGDLTGVVCRASMTGTAPSATVTMTLVPFNTVEFDTTGGFDATTSLYTVSVPGTYRVSVRVKLGNFTPGSSALQIYRNGVSLATSESWSLVAFEGMSMQDLVQCVAGDTISASVALSTAGPYYIDSPTGNYIIINRVSN